MGRMTAMGRQEPVGIRRVGRGRPGAAATWTRDASDCFEAVNFECRRAPGDPELTYKSSIAMPESGRPDLS